MANEVVETAKYIDSPKRYEVKEDEETGALKYSQIWIKGGIVGFEPMVADILICFWTIKSN